MTCKVKIDPSSVVGIIPTVGSTSPTSIIVSGTAEDCTNVEVRLRCAGTTIAATGAVDSSGNWTVEVTSITEAECSCGGNVTITALCVGGPPDCMDTFTGHLPCQPGECPIFHLTVPSIS